MSYPKVSVVTITYGHEKYIIETLQGVLMQQFDGPVEFIIANDNSPDETDEVVKNYFRENSIPANFEIKYTKHEINKGIVPNFVWVFEQTNGKYIAFCEGDDYWTDPLKLQKQVDFLEAHEDYGMVHTQTNYTTVTTGEEKLSATNRSKNSFQDLVYKNCIATLTTCMRSDLAMHYMAEVKPIEKNWVAGDLPMWLWFSLHSKIHHIADVTTMYRVIPGSASNTNSSSKYLDFVKSRRSIKEYFIKNYAANNVLLQFVAEDFYKDAKFHALKLRDKSTINEMGNYFYSKKNKKIGSYYLLMMNKLIDYPLLYQFGFNAYRVYYKFIKKHRKYEF